MEALQDTYKDTKIGRIPKDWEVVRLEEVLLEFQNGYAFSAKGYQENGIPIVSMAYIGLEGKFKFNYKKANYWSEKERETLSRYLLKKEDLIIAMTDVTPNKNLIGRMAQIDIDDEFFLNQRVGLLRCNNRIEKNFLMYLGNSKIWRSYAIGYSTLGVQTNLGTKEIKKGRIPLPSLTEQKKIAEILSTVDEQISLTEKIIEKSKELKKGLMQKLFSEGIGHTEFKDTKIGRIPKEWEVKAIGEIVETSSGGTPLRTNIEYYDNGNIPWVKTGELSNKYLFESDEHITEKAISKSSAKLFPKFSILVAMYGATIGKMSIIMKEMASNQACCALFPNDKIFFEYLYYSLIKRKENLISRGVGGAQPNISQKLIKVFELPIPPLSEQQKIAEILSEADAKIEKEEQEKAKLEELKKGLMQQLLTGKKRVKV